ncbi:exodeoxyribonuclease V subunit alpha [Cellulomonas sp. Leaf395]|uniref:exodeoxyribonuclease V subunit alpha n=1 Tax=Cellulomonas sp. Leaf395 TaxID=1736362 RepID=UPI0006FE3AD8|nr:exodeoxyribonuclease V subunit alpha [Cellulomonas sp. Leaf395]KQT01226.1 exodeoxyribonuclease V subunit alpha [Cellulomonas sp. Leaf395]
MTTTDDPYGATIPRDVTGLLASMGDVLTAADVHVARRLGAIGGEDDERVLLAAALAVQALRSGSVCVVLDDGTWPAVEGWHEAIRRSPLVADGPDGQADRPLRWVDGRVYLDRYWRDEQTVRAAMHDRLSRPATADADALDAAVDRLYPSATDAAQREALRTAATSHLMVLTGGPGTGKTTTVARLVAALQAAAGPHLRVALAAPTGKAAARLQESVNAEVALLGAEDVGRVRATTVHRLLGWRPGTTTRFRHDRLRRLPHDVVIVDESSMVSLSLMARLVEALRPTARLVLVGDPDQLASVEAGAILSDLVAALPRGVVRLTQAHRYGPALAALAEAIRAGDAETTLALLRSGDEHRELIEPADERLSAQDVAGLRSDLETSGHALAAAARDGDAASALRALGTHRLLLAHREGPFGVAHWAATAEAWIGSGPGVWPLGRPLLVTENDRASGLYNGDTGVVISDRLGGVVVAFGEPEDPRLVRPYRLPAVQPVHAMTVHRGQGSQFHRVTLLLPPDTSPLLTRELLYTAVTRAREHVRVIGTEDAIRAAVERPVRRASGLREPR